MNSPLIKNLLCDLKSNDYDKQISAINKLQKLDAQESITALINFGLSSGDDSVRYATIEALQQLSQNKSNSSLCLALTKSLSDSDSLNRSEALDALANLKCASAVKAIQNSLQNDPKWLVRVSAIEALIQLCEDDDVSTFQELEIALEDSHEMVRSYAAWGIGVLGRKELLPKLQKCYVQENFLRVKVDILAAKYRLGIKEDLKNILDLLDLIEEEDNFLVIQIVNILQELSGEENLHLHLKENLFLILHSLTKISKLFPSERNQIEQLIVKLEGL